MLLYKQFLTLKILKYLFIEFFFPGSCQYESIFIYLHWSFCLCNTELRLFCLLAVLSPVLNTESINIRFNKVIWYKSLCKNEAHFTLRRDLHRLLILEYKLCWPIYTIISNIYFLIFFKISIKEMHLFLCPFLLFFTHDR